MKKEIKLSISSTRKLHFIFNRKQREQILTEASYYNTIYPALTIQETLDVVIQKHIKMKLHKVVFPDISKQIKLHQQILDEIF
jgi:hypothetical protein